MFHAFIMDGREFVKTHAAFLTLATAAGTALVGMVMPEATTTIALGFFIQTLITEA